MTSGWAFLIHATTLVSVVNGTKADLDTSVARRPLQNYCQCFIAKLEDRPKRVCGLLDSAIEPHHSHQPHTEDVAHLVRSVAELCCVSNLARAHSSNRMS